MPVRWRKGETASTKLVPSQSAPGDEVAESPLRISMYEAFGALESESLDFNSTGAFAAFPVFFRFFLLHVLFFLAFVAVDLPWEFSLFTLISSMDGKIVSLVSRVLLLPHDSEILRWAGAHGVLRHRWHSRCRSLSEQSWQLDHIQFFGHWIVCRNFMCLLYGDRSWRTSLDIFTVCPKTPKSESISLRELHVF